MKLIFKWLRPIESQQSTMSGCKITSYFLNFQIFFRFSLGARKHREHNCFPIEDITICPLKVSLFSPMPDIPNFLSYAYHLLNRPCPTANIGRSDVACGIVQPKTGAVPAPCVVRVILLVPLLLDVNPVLMRLYVPAISLLDVTTILVRYDNERPAAMKNKTRYAEDKLPSVRFINKTGYPSMSDSLCCIVLLLICTSRTGGHDNSPTWCCLCCHYP